MGAGKGVALRFLQWFLRGIEFCCAGLVLAIYSYFLATMHNHNLDVGTWIRAVEGISGAGALYTAIGLLLLCCLAGLPFTSFLAIALDVAFMGAFVYVAIANRGGAGSCTGQVDTPFGSGDADASIPDGSGNASAGLPSFRTACKLETACFAVSLVAIFFFAFSALTEFAMARNHRREKRFGPSPANNYTSGSARGSLFGWGRSRRGRDRVGTFGTANALPEHTHPDAVRNSYNTETTAVGATDGVPTHPLHEDPHHHHKKFLDPDDRLEAQHETGLVQDPPEPAHYPAGNYRYDDGVYNTR